MPASTTLGGRLTPRGATFGLLAPRASGVDLCLFDGILAAAPSRKVPLQRGNDGVWSTQVPGLCQGQLYGFSVKGPVTPHPADRFCEGKILLDPWGLALGRPPRWHPDLRGNVQADAAAYAPLSRLVSEDPPLPRLNSVKRRHSLVVGEAHARGLTRLHPEIPPDWRGTWKGLGHPAVTTYLKRLGVTALELLPVHAHADDEFLVARGLTNYWGYSTLGYFAPHPGWASEPGCERTELRDAVQALHEAGIEVWLDVVFNHTAEGDDQGPVLCWKGLGAADWYRVHSDGRSVDLTGCGNTLDGRLPLVRRMIRESLVHWASAFGIDGFRFDLASVLGRSDYGFKPESLLMRELRSEPALKGVRLVAEPWDATSDGYALGRFPVGWSEWNDRFRDAARAFWRGDPGRSRDLALRLAGSPDVFDPILRGPEASVNFVTCHDGFTLRDLGTFENRRNEANLEGGRDGSSHNLSTGFGAEGHDASWHRIERRSRHARNLLASLLLARGIPMILLGDELGRSQSGNNNAYCQDNEISWLSWRADHPLWDLRSWISDLLDLRRQTGLDRTIGQHKHAAWAFHDRFGTSLDMTSPRSWPNEGFQALWSPNVRTTGLLLLVSNMESPVGFRPVPSARNRDWTHALSSVGVRILRDHTIELAACGLSAFVDGESSV